MVSTLTIENRERLGSSAARQYRKLKKLPGVIYNKEINQIGRASCRERV